MPSSQGDNAAAAGSTAASDTTRRLAQFLEEEKRRTHDRMRQCAVFLNDASLSEDVLTPALRDSLESVRRNAEDDFSSLRHLIEGLARRDGRWREVRQEVAAEVMSKKSKMVTTAAAERGVRKVEEKGDEGIGLKM